MVSSQTAFSSIWSYLCKAAKPKTQLNPTEENHRSFLHAKKLLLTFSKNARKTKRQVFYTWHGASFNTTFGCDFIKEVKHICFFHVVQCAQLQGPSVSSNTALKSQHILEQDTLNLVVDVRGQYWSIQPSHWRRVWRAQGRREHTRAWQNNLEEPTSSDEMLPLWCRWYNTQLKSVEFEKLSIVIQECDLGWLYTWEKWAFSLQKVKIVYSNNWN